ncbi:unnamed protein product [Zymoseptoria tritici ST99CH_3D1]|nr:unnamed protein product [Zymoseptoria tritici ST99CH_3D1]
MGLLTNLTNLKDKVEAARHSAAAPSPPSAAQPQTQPSSSSKPCSKRGLCWPLENNNNNDQVSAFTRPGTKVSWLYNWSPNPTTCSLEWVPMSWNTADMSSLAGKVAHQSATHLLAFNEPELPDQSNISVSSAAAAWLEHIEPIRRTGVRCGSPGISSAGHAVKWLQDFVSAIRQGGSDVDFWAIHWYGVDLGGFYDYIWSTHHQLGPEKPVWITEFAATNWNESEPLPREHVENFARESFKYLDTLDWVERYCWFGPMRNTGTVGKWARMYDDEGKLTALGKAYRDE